MIMNLCGISNDIPPDPPIIKAKSINCTGLINIMRRSVGLSVPGLNENSLYPGGICEWYTYLRDKGVLHEFDYNLVYPRGTLFLRKYNSAYDQGHVAVLYEVNGKGCLYSTILHSSCDYEFEPEVYLNPGVNVNNTLGQSHFYFKEGYYQYYSLPQDWLLCSVY